MNSANTAWRDRLASVLAGGEAVRPRGQPCVEQLHQATVVDLERSLVTLAARKLNHRFAAAEALWILNGSDRLSDLLPFNSRMAEFSDDGATLTGAYGPRIVPQLSWVVRQLLDDPSTRQAVASIWTPTPHKSKDIPCLAGDTIIPSPEGDITIAELASRRVARHPVYTWDRAADEVKIAWLTRAWKSGRKSTLKVTFDDGSSLTATADHRLWRKDRQKIGHEKKKGSSTVVREVTIGDLNPGDRVCATHFLFDVKTGKRRIFIRKLLNKNWAFANQQKEQNEYANLVLGPKPDGWVLHHRDDDPTNNKAENLQYMTEADHNRLHHLGDLNPMKRETKVANKLRRQKLRETWKRKGKNFWDHPWWLNTNHKVVSIEPAGVRDVYDFEVPGTANAVVGTGIAVHNCTLALTFMIRKNQLHCHAFMRSSDVWLGLPYDLFSFSQVALHVLARVNSHRRNTRRALTEDELERDGPYAAVRPGRLYLTAASSHLYDVNREAAEAALKQSPLDPATQLTPLMPDFTEHDLLARLYGLLQHGSSALERT